MRFHKPKSGKSGKSAQAKHIKGRIGQHGGFLLKIRLISLKLYIFEHNERLSNNEDFLALQDFPWVNIHVKLASIFQGGELCAIPNCTIICWG